MENGGGVENGDGKRDAVVAGIGHLILAAINRQACLLGSGNPRNLGEETRPLYLDPMMKNCPGGKK